MKKIGHYLVIVTMLTAHSVYSMEKVVRFASLYNDAIKIFQVHEICPGKMQIVKEREIAIQTNARGSFAVDKKNEMFFYARGYCIDVFKKNDNNTFVCMQTLDIELAKKESAKKRGATVSSLTFDEQNNVLISSDMSGEIKVWRANSKGFFSCVQSIVPLRDHGHDGTADVLSCDGILFSGFRGGDIKIWNMNSITGMFEYVQEISGYAFVACPKHGLLASAFDPTWEDDYNKRHLWQKDSESFNYKAELRTPFDVTAFAIDDQDILLFSGYYGGLITVDQINKDDIAATKCMQKIDIESGGHTSDISTLIFDEKTKLLFSRSYDGLLNIWKKDKAGQFARVAKEKNTGPLAMLNMHKDESIEQKDKKERIRFIAESMEDNTLFAKSSKLKIMIVEGSFFNQKKSLFIPRVCIQ